MDGFESTQSSMNLLNPYAWNLVSTPYEGSNPKLPEAEKMDDIVYGKNRTLLAWYAVNGTFTRKSSPPRPRHLANDDLSNHYTRGISYKEAFPNKELGTDDNTTLPVLNFALYPSERGPYSLGIENINSGGTLSNPRKR